MSDNRKYYYLKLKENYFDDDSNFLEENAGVTRQTAKDIVNSEHD